MSRDVITCVFCKFRVGPGTGRLSHNQQCYRIVSVRIHLNMNMKKRRVLSIISNLKSLTRNPPKEAKDRQSKSVVSPESDEPNYA